MITGTYPIEQNETATQFLFFSEGVKGRILKAVFISHYERHRWNLAFGDVGADWEIDDKAKTNNNDVVKVLGTVAKAALIFSETYPERALIIFPVDEKRKRLYNLIFRRKLTEIEMIFHVFGKRGRRWEAFNYQTEEYDAFELLRKNL
ncbi:MAG: DUF6934 family protein [Saprospiraceae bacterium]